MNLLRRGLIAIFGICAIAWAIDVVPVYHADAPLADTVQRILSGDKFNAAQLSVMKNQLDEASAKPLRASGLNNAALIRLLFLEAELNAGNRQLAATDISELQMTVNAALAQSPTNSFMWLTDFWLKRMGNEYTDDNVNLLRMSYRFGPNESWIAAKRNRLALSMFSSLPGDLAEQAQSEFVGLVRSRFYVEASEILAGPGWAIHERLLAGVVQVDEEHRRGFARALASRDIDGVTVPGVAKRPDRPF